MTAPDWRTVAFQLYDALRRLEDNTPGGWSYTDGIIADAALGSYEAARDAADFWQTIDPAWQPGPPPDQPPTATFGEYLMSFARGPRP